MNVIDEAAVEQLQAFATTETNKNDDRKTEPLHSLRLMAAAAAAAAAPAAPTVAAASAAGAAAAVAVVAAAETKCWMRAAGRKKQPKQHPRNQHRGRYHGRINITIITAMINQLSPGSLHRPPPRPPATGHHNSNRIYIGQHM